MLCHKCWVLVGPSASKQYKTTIYREGIQVSPRSKFQQPVTVTLKYFSALVQTKTDIKVVIKFIISV